MYSLVTTTTISCVLSCERGNFEGSASSACVIPRRWKHLQPNWVWKACGTSLLVDTNDGPPYQPGDEGISARHVSGSDCIRICLSVSDLSVGRSTRWRLAVLGSPSMLASTYFSHSSSARLSWYGHHASLSQHAVYNCWHTCSFQLRLRDLCSLLCRRILLHPARA